MNTRFKIGNVVKQKSGTTKMTISRINPNGTYECVWEINQIPESRILLAQY